MEGRRHFQKKKNVRKVALMTVKDQSSRDVVLAKNFVKNVKVKKRTGLKNVRGFDKSIGF